MVYEATVNQNKVVAKMMSLLKEIWEEMGWSVVEIKMQSRADAEGHYVDCIIERNPETHQVNIRTQPRKDNPRLPVVLFCEGEKH